MSKLSNQLVQVSKNLDADPIQFYGDNVTLKRHIMLADPDPVAANIIEHRLKKMVMNPFFSKISDLLLHPAKDDIAAILIDSRVSGGGIDMVRQLHKTPDF